VRFGCEGLVVFWGGCVVFWCSFWVCFWLSESLRGVFTPARNGRLQGRGIIPSRCIRSSNRVLLAAATEIKEHNQQVGVVYNSVTVDIFWYITPAAAESK